MINKHWAKALILLAGVVGSAFARDESLQEVPVAVSVLRGDQLAGLGIVDAAALAGRTPGVSLSDSNSEGPANATFSIRGVGSDNTLVLVNGRRATTSTSSQVQTDVGLIPTQYINRVEVLTGPTGSLYGSDAMAGVINLVPSDNYIPAEPAGSTILEDATNAIGSFWFSLQSKEECDASDGTPKPAFSYFDSHDYGAPKFSSDGQAFLGSPQDGFDPYPLFGPTYDYKLKEPTPSFIGSPTFTRFDELVERVKNDASIPENYKTAFYTFLGFAHFAGANIFSDLAYAFGTFDPDAMFKQLKTHVAMGALDGLSSDFYSPPGASSSPPKMPAPKTPAPTVVTDVKQAPDNPFDRFPYPPGYAFDFGQCKHKQEILALIASRDRARADASYFNDYLRRPGQTAADVKADQDAVEEALGNRDKFNEELRAKWLECITPSQTATAAPTTRQSLGIQPYYDRFNLELKVEYKNPGINGTVDREPVPDIGIGAHLYNEGLKFKTPFSAGAVRDTESGASSGTSRAFTNDYGIGRFEFRRDSDLNLGLNYRSDDSESPTAAPRPGQDITLELTESLPTARSYQDYLQLIPKVQVGSREADDWNWKIGARYDMGIPTFQFKVNFDKIDSVVQEYTGLGGPGVRFGDLAPNVLDSIPSEFKDRAGDGFSIGSSFYVPYNFSEHLELDLGAFDKIKGQGGWSNNFCSDAAASPEVLGYVAAAVSPVKSLADQWAFKRAGVGAATTAGEAITVAVIDTGIDWNHLDFSWDNLWRNEDEIPDNGKDDDNNGFVDDLMGWDFVANTATPWDNDGHGTFVAGIIAAGQGNDAGIEGINPNAKIMVLKALNSFGRTRASYVAQAIVYAADNGAHIVNLSVSPGFPKVVQDAVNYAKAKGVLIIAAAGNQAESVDTLAPAALKGVMTVAATNSEDQRAEFSNVGAVINLAAPGVDVLSLRARRTDFMFNSSKTSYWPGDAFIGDDKRYYRSTGTSFSTAIVSGIASLVWSQRPTLTAEQVQQMLEQSARDVETPGRDDFTGYGIVDAKAAQAADPEFFIFADIPGVQRSEVDGQVALQVLGVADANDFANARLEVGAGESPETWISVADELVQPVQLGVLGQIPADQFAGGETWTIRVIVTHQNGKLREARYIVDLSP